MLRSSTQSLDPRALTLALPLHRMAMDSITCHDLGVFSGCPCRAAVQWYFWLPLKTRHTQTHQPLLSIPNPLCKQPDWSLALIPKPPRPLGIQGFDPQTPPAPPTRSAPPSARTRTAAPLRSEPPPLRAKGSELQLLWPCASVDDWHLGTRRM